MTALPSSLVHHDAPVNVLVVDDVPQNLVAMEALLARPGLRILKAASGPDALELLLAHEVAVALLDVHMPDMDGFELAELMRGREATRHIPLIFLTAAQADRQRLFRGYEAGAVDFLHKPIDPHVISGKVAVFVDLFQQRRDLSRQMEALQQALQWNEMLMSVVGHDLRTPLMAMLTNTEVILRAPASDELILGRATRIKASGWRMARMIEQLMDMARIRSGGLLLHPGQADLGALAHSICAEQQAGCRNDQGHPGDSRLQVEVVGDPRGVFDSDRIQQVLSNLVANALHHGQPDEPVRVRVDGLDARTLAVSVHNGGSIPPEALERLFAPFHRGRPADSTGLGLGLYIVEQFIKAHQGQVHVESTPSEGTTFEVRFPRHAAPASSAPAEGTPAADAASARG